MLHTIQAMMVATFDQILDILSIGLGCNAEHHSGLDSNYI